MLLFEFNDAGGPAPRKNDCVIRAIAIAAELPCDQVYEDLGKPDTTHGIAHRLYWPYLRRLGWTPTRLTYRKDRTIPEGRVILEMRYHLAAVIDHVVHDTKDPILLLETMRERYPHDRMFLREAPDWTHYAWLLLVTRCRVP
jgi:hypothetical protein